MSLFTTRRLLACSLALTTFLVASGSESSTYALATGASPDDSSVSTSLDPLVDVENASSAQLRKLADALDRFSTAGLHLPDLQVRFFDDDADCPGRFGMFTSTADSFQISICSEMYWIYVHELAHAWERTAMTDQQRKDFMALGGYTVWADHSVPWRERAVEGVAFTVQQGLSGLPLPPALSDEHHDRLAAFHFLTGQPDPRLAEWKGSESERDTKTRYGPPGSAVGAARAWRSADS